MGKDNFGPDLDDQVSLSKRYLFWLYKTTRDELDKVDRKFMQLAVDNEIYKKLKKAVKRLGPGISGTLEAFLREWQEYIFQKDSDAQKLKYSEDGKPNHAYLSLRLKLEAIEAVVRGRFGKKQLLFYKELYEDAAYEVILQDNSGRR